MIFAFGPFEIDDGLFELRKGGIPLPVQRKTLDLLLCLIRMRGSVVTREQLIRDVWSGVVVSEAVLTQAILTVRKALSDDGLDPKIVKTARGRGYRFAMEVEEISASPARPPRDEVVRSTEGGSVFVGRARELAQLQEAAKDAREGRGRIVLVMGPQGIGKSRLVDELVQRNAHLRLVRAYGYPGDGAPALWPWLQIQRRLDERDDGGEETEDLTSSAARFRFGDRLTRRLLEMARQEPLLLVIEDVQWVDVPSLELLTLLGPQVAKARLMIALTTRVPARASGADGGALGALARLPLASTIELGPLGHPEIAALVHAMTGGASSPGIVARVAEKTGGVPALFMQIAHILSPNLPRAAGTSAMLGTTAVKEAIAQQVASLSNRVRDALTLAAVMGTSFSLGPLALALETTTDAAIGFLDEAIDARVVSKGTEQGTYRFTQPLVRDALFRRGSEGERARLHGLVGKALITFLGPERAEAHAAEIAPHLVEMAVLGDIEDAVRFALLAHAQACAKGDHAGAARFIELARRALRCGRASPETEALRGALEAATRDR